jgi:small subunit ribosomal protein S6
MALYETIFIARQDLSTTQVQTLTSTATDIIKKNKGFVGKTELWIKTTSISYR